MAIAIGATVITAISINTPTAHMIMVEIERAIMARFCPNLFTIASAIFSADPVLIRAPARIPDVRIRSTDDIILDAPLTIVLTVCTRSPLPISPPIRAPAMTLYAG